MLSVIPLSNWWLALAMSCLAPSLSPIYKWVDDLVPIGFSGSPTVGPGRTGQTCPAQLTGEAAIASSWHEPVERPALGVSEKIMRPRNCGLFHDSWWSHPVMMMMMMVMIKKKEKWKNEKKNENDYGFRTNLLVTHWWKSRIVPSQEVGFFLQWWKSPLNSNTSTQNFWRNLFSGWLASTCFAGYQTKTCRKVKLMLIIISMWSYQMFYLFSGPS